MSTADTRLPGTVSRLAIQLPAVVVAAVGVAVTSLFVTVTFAVAVGLVCGVVTAALVSVLHGMVADGSN